MLVNSSEYLFFEHFGLLKGTCLAKISFALSTMINDVMRLNVLFLALIAENESLRVRVTFEC